MDLEIGPNLFHLFLFILIGIGSLIYYKTIYYNNYYSLFEKKESFYDPNSKKRHYAPDPRYNENYYS